MSFDYSKPQLQTNQVVLGHRINEGNRREWVTAEKRKIKENFLNFCNIVLDYTEFVPSPQRNMAKVRNIDKKSPNASGLDSNESEISSDGNEDSEDISSEESYNLISCFCHKPFSGRPMIECSKCLVWIHLSCAKVRRSKIPEEFICQTCKQESLEKRVSNRIRFEKRQIQISD